MQDDSEGRDRDGQSVRPSERPTEASPRHGGVRLAGLLVLTFAVQAVGTLAVLTIPALAPMVARALDVPTSYVGYQVAIVYLAAMLGSLGAGTFVGRFGPCRTSQIGMLVNAAGCVLIGVPHAGMVAFGSIVLGGGYGLLGPAASELLMRHCPADRRNLIFSLKQTGVPMGGMIAGLVAPTAAIAFGWQAVLWSVAGCSLLAVAAWQPSRALLDRPPGGSSAATWPLRALASVMTAAALRWLALSSLFFSGLQMCVIAFLVALLVEDLHYDLVTAGVILGVVQIAGALGRIVWGHVADLLRDGLVVLLGLALVMAAAAAVVALGGAALPAWLSIGTFILLGLSAVGWNGVYMSELARLSPARMVGTTTGAAMFFTFSGVLLGPSLFSSVHALLGSYVGSYVLLVAFALFSAAMLAAVRFR